MQRAPLLDLQLSDLYAQLYADTPKAEILARILEATPNNGVNMLHAIITSDRYHEWSSWLIFLWQVVERDQPNKAEHAETVYRILNERMSYYPNYKVRIDRPIDRLGLSATEKVNTYAELVLKLATFGLAREKVEELLKLKNPADETLRKVFWKIAYTWPAELKLELINSGFLQEKELASFVKYKEELLLAVKEEPDEQKKYQYLKWMLDVTTPLGHIFSAKKRGELFKPSINYGIWKEVKQTHDTLQASFAKIAKTVVSPAELPPSPRPVPLN